MNKSTDDGNPLIFPIGTRVVLLRDQIGMGGRVEQARGAVGIVVRAPVDHEHSYRVRFVDSSEATLRAEEIGVLARFKEGKLDERSVPLEDAGLLDRVILRCVMGSRAYGLENENSDVDRRGVYLPRAEDHWSLFGVPEQIECDRTQETYWEFGKFLVMALKANPNILECLYSPILENVSPLGRELVDFRQRFLSKLVYQTYNGYVLSQFRKIEADLRNHGQVRWKHAMHLIRLLLAGITILRENLVPVRVVEHRDHLLEIKHGNSTWEKTNAWRLQLHAEFEQALTTTRLPDRPDDAGANQLLIHARRLAVDEKLP